MLNKTSIKEVTEYQLDENFYKPHPTYNIKYLLNSIQANLGNKKDKILPEDCFKEKKEVQHTIFILLDGLGFNLLEECLPLLPKEIQSFFEKELLVSKLTTIYPSSTTSVIPFVMTGYLPEESGIYEWWQYEYISEKIILPFRYIYRDGMGNHLDMKDLNIKPESIYKTSKFYKELKDNNILPYMHRDRNYSTPFNIISSEPANIIEEGKITNSRIKAIEIIKENIDKKTFQYIYDPYIDSCEHKLGRNSKEASATVQSKLFEIYQLIKDLKENNLENVQVIVTADHGLTQYEQEEEIILDEVFPDVYKYLKTNSKGEYITYGGSPRSCVLHIQEDLIENFKKAVTPHIKGFAEIFTREELIEKNILNKDIKLSEAFSKNFGNIVIMAYNHKGVWFKEKEVIKFKGHHGGLSQDELQIPLMVY